MDNIASIEIGTNSIRMLIAERATYDGQIKPVLRRRSITRLGEDFGIKSAGVLKPQAIERSISVLKDFLDLAAHYGVSSPKIVATGAVRRATNGVSFSELITERLAHTARIISGQEEADLTWRGVIASLKQVRGGAVIFDLGGGSTEFIFSDQHERRSTSIDLGAVTLTENYLLNDPPTDGEIHQLTDYISRSLQRLLDEWKANLRGAFFLVGAGGTAVTLAAMIHGIEVNDLDERLNGLAVQKEGAKDLLKKMKGMPKAGISRIKGLETGREDIILAGVLVVVKVMEYFEKDEILISYSDLLEGILLEYMEEEENGESINERSVDL
jgi:exopolyphosphatase/guanosine-5'-triphosphate,3'-diphosphate pyrophosphatase